MVLQLVCNYLTKLHSQKGGELGSGDERRSGPDLVVEKADVREHCKGRAFVRLSADVCAPAFPLLPLGSLYSQVKCAVADISFDSHHPVPAKISPPPLVSTGPKPSATASVLAHMRLSRRTREGAGSVWHGSASGRLAGSFVNVSVLGSPPPAAPQTSFQCQTAP